jgi:hypothetical protein
MLNVVHMIHRALNYSKHVFMEGMKDISITLLISSVIFVPQSRSILFPGRTLLRLISSHSFLPILSKLLLTCIPENQ